MLTHILKCDKVHINRSSEDVQPLGSTLDFKTLTLKEARPEQIVALWEFFKPKEPSTPEPLFVWPRSPGLVYLIRLASYSIKMKQSGWDQFHREYQLWYFKVMNHYNALVAGCAEQDRHKNPQLMRLWDFQMQAQNRLRENTISQSEWSRRRRTRVHTD